MATDAGRRQRLLDGHSKRIRELGFVISLDWGAAWAGKRSGEFWERLIPEDIAGLDAAEDSNRLTTSPGVRVRTLPFSCPFGAAKAGKARQRSAQGETEKAPDFSRGDARSGNGQQRAAKRG
jgi:hypothetical protein